jgi:hypothetical protein
MANDKLMKPRFSRGTGDLRNLTKQILSVKRVLRLIYALNPGSRRA